MWTLKHRTERRGQKADDYGRVTLIVQMTYVGTEEEVLALQEAVDEMETGPPEGEPELKWTSVYPGYEYHKTPKYTPVKSSVPPSYWGPGFDLSKPAKMIYPTIQKFPTYQQFSDQLEGLTLQQILGTYAGPGEPLPVEDVPEDPPQEPT